MNRLQFEKSPYLLQHRNNPVDWYPWGPEAFEAARASGRPVFLSVGYSTCHWCHVMERESFEDREVADRLNAGYVSIKVDREERPDLDDFYMTAVTGMTGRGGWPMSVWLTPDAKPFYGGTYFPKPHFLEVLERIRAAWQENRGRLDEVAASLTGAILEQDRIESAGSLDAGLFSDWLDGWMRGFDAVHGGRRGAPKFPPAWDIRMLLRVHARLGRPEALASARLTLDTMARGGIYDHLDGGFARYATDERWLVPHFEKMLYDQAALAPAYIEAWQATGDAEYAAVAREILDYVLRDMTHPEGGFFSAEDADAEGEEGRFSVWTEAELRDSLGPAEYQRLAAAFDISPRGNFEHGTNVLALRPKQRRTERDPRLRQALALLAERRSRRERPLRDDKVLTAWNGLMISAMAFGAAAFEEPRYAAAAAAATRFVLRHAAAGDGALLARWREGEARFPGTLDDHAFLIHGLIDLYQADFDPGWLHEALRLQEAQEKRFSDAETGGYFFNDGSDALLPGRGRQVHDNVLPAGSSIACLNLLRLSDLTGRLELRDRALKVFASASAMVKRAPALFPALLTALDYALGEGPQIAIVSGADSEGGRRLLSEARRGFVPGRVVAAGGAAGAGPAILEGKMPGDAAAAWVCARGACGPALREPGALRAALTA